MLLINVRRCTSRESGKVPYMLAIFIFTCSTTLADGTIRIISVNENETVYTVQERSLFIRSSDGLEGILVKSQPPDACTKVNPPEDNNGTYLVNWILLATYEHESIRPPCSINKKIRNAEEAGYSGIIIQTNPGNDSNYIPVFDWSGVTIFPCLVTFADGKILEANYTSDDYILKFEDEPMNSWLGFFLASVLVIVAILFAIGLSYVIVQMLVLIIIWIRETVVNSIQQRRRDRRRRLPSSQLKKLPVQQWTSEIPMDVCTICLENFMVEEVVRILPCSHVFHKLCIDPWLTTQRRRCPNCKAKIVFADERCDSDTSTEDERTPLLRRDGSVDRDRNQVFTFNESDIARNPPSEFYSAIQRMLDESLTSEPDPSPAHSSSSSAPILVKESADPIRTHLRNMRLSKFAPKLGKNPFQTSQDVQPLPTTSEPQNSESTSSTVPSDDPNLHHQAYQVDDIATLSHPINQGDDIATESDSNQMVQSPQSPAVYDNTSNELSDNHNHEVNNQTAASSR